MSFSLFLNEGLIKLPPKLQADLHQFFLHSYLSQLFYLALEKAEDDTDRKMIESISKKMAAQYKTGELDMKLGKKLSTQPSYTQKFPNEIPAQYVEAYAKKEGKLYANALVRKASQKPMDLKCTIGFRKIPKDAGAQGVYHPNRHEIVISVPGCGLHNEQMLDLIGAMRISIISNKINNALGTMDHELTHAIQELILSKLHEIQGDDKNQSNLSGKEKDSAYNTSQVEFDPKIKSSLAAIRAAVGFAKASPAEKKKMIVHYTWGDVPVDKVADNEAATNRSEFFMHLKKLSIVRWKKAVKLFTAALQDDLK